MNENIRKKYLSKRKKTYIMAHPTILRMFIVEKGIHARKMTAKIWGELMTFHGDAADRVPKFKNMLTVNYIKNNAKDCSWILIFLYSYEDAMEYFLKTNKNDMNMSGWPYNKFTWSELIYKRELARDIAAHRTEILCSTDLVKPITEVIARYIDYK